MDTIYLACKNVINFVLLCIVFVGWNAQKLEMSKKGKDFEKWVTLIHVKWLHIIVAGKQINTSIKERVR